MYIFVNYFKTVDIVY